MTWTPYIPHLMSPNFVLKRRRMEQAVLRGLANSPGLPAGSSVAPWPHTPAPKTLGVPSTPRPTALTDKDIPIHCIVLFYAV